MKRIGLLSDTHGYLDQSILNYLSECDEIWHAGDIGNIALADTLSSVKPLKAVYGNIDGQDVRIVHPKDLVFRCEDVSVFMTHIGGYPGKYNFQTYEKLKRNKFDIFICGHSHILKIIYAKHFKLLHINPGAAGKHGFHQIRTLVRFSIDKKEIKDMQVIELGKRG